jgi:hypothetical protein
LHGNGFEEQGLTVHIHLQKGDLPMTPRDVRLLHVKCAAFVQMTKQTAVELDRPDEMTLDLCQPVLFFVNPDPPFHGVKDRRLVGRRTEIPIRLKENFHEATLMFSKPCAYGVRQHFE